ncbi:MAG: Rho termination factor N-terminal domain-containing protein [Lachnospiraceae bacterium]|nr:Rho termination factor N-terminal domain-containing protein [Roseburia sp.]MBP3468268.1 Rho termination factor N-terminal domain-containing protein [Lachnospiraceae bacterium]
MILKRGNVERIAEDDAMIRKFMADGFKPAGGDIADTRPEAAKSISDMSIGELKAIAKEKGIESAGSLKKDELLAVLKDVNLDD